VEKKVCEIIYIILKIFSEIKKQTHEQYTITRNVLNINFFSNS